jgi:hypothetical protein
MARPSLGAGLPRDEFHRFFKISLQAHKAFAVTAAVGVKLLHFLPVGVHELVAAARQFDAEGGHAAWCLPAGPTGKMRKVIGDYDERAAERTDPRPHINNHEDVACEDGAEKQAENDAENRHVEEVRKFVAGGKEHEQQCSAE